MGRAMGIGQSMSRDLLHQQWLFQPKWTLQHLQHCLQQHLPTYSL